MQKLNRNLLTFFILSSFIGSYRKSQQQMGAGAKRKPHLSAGLTGSVPNLLFDIYVFFEKT